ncbi:MAG: hypothetical protein RSC65_02055 [Malacoplasma sp.]
MANDISKCANENCERKKECYRYTCAPNKLYQSYSLFLETDCEYFIENNKEDKHGN